MAGLTPARPKPGRFAPSPKIFGEGATDNAPAGRGEGGGEAGLARVTYFDAITLGCPCLPLSLDAGKWREDARGAWIARAGAESASAPAHSRSRLTVY